LRLKRKSIIGNLMAAFDGHWVAASGVDWLPFLTRRPVAKC
jgi:hypothetical protein